jgi:hypothetical protein
MPLTQDEFLQQRTAIRGQGNPQSMRVPLWEELIRSGESACTAASRYGHEHYDDPPGWCFHRFGMTRTRLHDGRIICIGGEHEDYYDPDFFIYNDVIVIQADGTLDIFGYSTNALLPTDFHTATLIGEAIYVVGGLGYQGQRAGAFTPVYRLDIASMRIENLTSENPSPGWIWGHRAHLAPDGVSIRVAGGKVLTLDPAGKESIQKNRAVFSFNTVQKIWSPAEDKMPALPILPLDEALHGWAQFDSLDESLKLQAAIMRAVAPNHPLFCESFQAIAKQNDWPRRVIIRMFDGSNRWAICDEPDYTGRQSQPGLAVSFFPTIASLSEAVNQAR